jgi:hypothetical protein
MSKKFDEIWAEEFQIQGATDSTRLNHPVVLIVLALNFGLFTFK